MAKLYKNLNIDNIFEEKIIIDNIIAYPQEQVAEIDGTQMLDVVERIKKYEEFLNDN